MTTSNDPFPQLPNSDDDQIDEDFSDWFKLDPVTASNCRDSASLSLDMLKNGTVLQKQIAAYCLNFLHPPSRAIADQMLDLIVVEYDNLAKCSMITYLGTSHKGSKNHKFLRLLAAIINDEREHSTTRCIAYCSMHRINSTSGYSDVSIVDIKSVESIDMNYVRRFV